MVIDSLKCREEGAYDRDDQRACWGRWGKWVQGLARMLGEVGGLEEDEALEEGGEELEGEGLEDTRWKPGEVSLRAWKPARIIVSQRQI